MSNSNDEEVTSERLEESVDSSTSSEPLSKKYDPDEAVMQGAVANKNDRRIEFSISLSRKEIEEDFYKIKGSGPDPNYRKRLKVMQKQVDDPFIFQMPISKDKEATSEMLRELADPSASSKPLLGKEDPGKAVMQETLVNKNDRRREYSISLSRKEIEEDFLAIKGTMPNPKPIMRPKVVQKQLDKLIPGSRLSEITKDMYKLDE